MPELPEVSTTVKGINELVRGLSIIDVWSDYPNQNHIGKKHIKDGKYMSDFRRSVVGAKILGARRIGKNVLIDLTNGKTIVTHLKMTGHFLYGKYKKIKTSGKTNWTATEDPKLQDPFNRFVRLIFTLSNKNHLALSDMRRFAKVSILDTDKIRDDSELALLGPDPTDKKLTVEEFEKRLLKRKSAPIKSALMDQTTVSGIGNIYSDEILWQTGIHPEKKVGTLKKAQFKEILDSARVILKAGLDAGGDSMSDYRNIRGEKGNFQNLHKVYRKIGKPCSKKGCKGVIARLKIGGRSAHFCPIHQK